MFPGATLPFGKRERSSDAAKIADMKEAWQKLLQMSIILKRNRVVLHLTIVISPDFHICMIREQAEYEYDLRNR